MILQLDSSSNVFDPEYDFIDLEPYRNGDKKMMFGCSHKGCNEKVDITKSYIIMEEQNNIRKQASDYNPTCDKLYIFTRYCAEHKGEYS